MALFACLLLLAGCVSPGPTPAPEIAGTQLVLAGGSYQAGAGHTAIAESLVPPDDWADMPAPTSCTAYSQGFTDRRNTCTVHVVSAQEQDADHPIPWSIRASWSEYRGNQSDRLVLAFDASGDIVAWHSSHDRTTLSVERVEGFTAWYESRQGVTVVAAGAAVGLALIAWKVLSSLGFFPGYSRLLPDHILDLPARRRIADLIAAQPAITRPELKRRLDLGWSTLGHHLYVLHKAGLVRSIRKGRHRYLFPADTAGDLGPLAVLANEQTRRVLTCVLDMGSPTRSEVSRRLGIDPTTARWHLDRLAEEGLVVAGTGGSHETTGAGKRLAAATTEGRGDLSASDRRRGMATRSPAGGANGR